MSFALTQKIIRTKLAISVTDKLVLLIIGDRVDGKGYSFPSLGLIASEVGVSTRTIQRSLTRLQRLGMLNVDGVNGGANHYRIIETMIIDIKCKKEQRGYDRGDTPTHDTSDTPPMTPMTLGGDTRDTLIDNIIDKGIDNLNKAGASPLNHISTFIKVGVEKLKQKEQGNMKTLDSIKTAIDGTGLKQKKNPPPKSQWQHVVAEWRYENEIHEGLLKLTDADMGMLNKAAKKVGKQFPQVLRDCVGYWKSFVKYASEQTGNGMWMPEQPSISFFVKNLDSAVSFDAVGSYVEPTITFNNEDVLD